jgi:hypothetical protein
MRPSAGVRGFRVRLLRNLWRTMGWAMLAIGIAFSPFVWTAGKVLRLAGEGALAEYRLSQVPPERYDAEIASALEAGDGDLVRSLLALADDRGVAVAPALTGRVAALPPIDVLNVLGQGWNCVVNGDFDSEAGFACVVATDLTGVGDVRDLVGEGGKYLTGQPVNYLTLGVASVGLTLTAATYATGGGLLPIRAGATFVKAMNKAAKLPPRLVAELSGVLGRSINATALDEAVLLARELRFTELQRPLSRLFNPRSVRVVEKVATDFGTIGAAGGVRAMKLSAGLADSTRDVGVMAKAATRYKAGYLGVVKLLGRGIVRVGDLLWTLGSWLVAAALWAWALVLFVLRAARGTARGLYRVLRRRRAAG